VEVPPETCRAVSRYKKLCNVASCWIYIRIHFNKDTIPQFYLFVFHGYEIWSLILKEKYRFGVFDKKDIEENI
jgi:hypothetical protein